MSQQKMLQDILDNIPGKVFVKDQDGVLVLLNTEVARVYKKSVEELKGTSDFDNHPYELAKEYRAKELEILAKGGETYIQEETVTGDRRFLKTSKMPFRLATTGKTGILGFQFDVTDASLMKETIVKLENEIKTLKAKTQSGSSN